MSGYYLGCELYTTGVIIFLYICLVTAILGPRPGLNFISGKKSKPNNNQKVFSPINQTYLKLLHSVSRSAL